MHIWCIWYRGVCVCVWLHGNLNTVADVCFLLGGYVDWWKISGWFCMSRSPVKVIFQTVQGHLIRSWAVLSWVQQSPHYLFLSLTWDFLPMIWPLMFQSFAWKNGRTYGMPVKPINFGGYQYKSSLSRRDAVLINRLRIDHTRLTVIYCQGMINQYVLLVSPRSLLSTFSLNVLILLLSVAGILVLLQWKMCSKMSTHKASQIL